MFSTLSAGTHSVPLTPRRAETSFWLVAAAFVVTTSFTTAPTPLWTMYQAAGGFETVWLTVAFSSYVVGVIIGLIIFGHVSDWQGRKPLLLTALGLQIVAAALFATSTGLAWIIAARAISGLGIGILTTTATAYLGELNNRAGRVPIRAVVVATAANLGGLGLGPIIGGLYAEHAAHPLFTPWIVYVVVLIGAFIVALAPSETVKRDPAHQYHLQRIVIDRRHRATYFASAASSFAFFAITGLSGSLEPKFLAQLGVSSHLEAGLASAAVFLTAVTSQLALVRVRTSAQLAFGSTFVALGAIAMTVGAIVPGWVPAFIIGAIVGGAGGGVLLKGALGTAARLAPTGHVTEASAGIFVISFLGMGAPVVVVGILTSIGVSLTISMVGFSLMVLLIVLASALTFARHPIPEREDATAA